MTSYPARVGGTPPAVLILDIKHIFERGVSADHITAVGMYDGFGLACGTRGVEDVKWIFRIHDFGSTSIPITTTTGNWQDRQIVIPVITTRLHRDLVTGPLYNDHILDRGAA